METRKQLRGQLEVVCSECDRKVQELERVRQESETKLQRLREERKIDLDSLNTEVERLQADVERETKRGDDLEKELKVFKGKEHALRTDIANYQKSMARLVKPVSLEEVTAVHPEFQCVAHASCFMLNPLDKFLPKLVLPKKPSCVCAEITVT